MSKSAADPLKHLERDRERELQYGCLLLPRGRPLARQIGERLQ
jgi:hypothetical protein